MNFKAGEIWNLNNKHKEIMLHVLKVENLENTKIVHIAILVNAEYIILHMPFTLDAIQESIIQLEKISYDFPNYEEGYNLWKTEYLKGNAGIYKLKVKDAIDL